MLYFLLLVRNNENWGLGQDIWLRQPAPDRCPRDASLHMPENDLNRGPHVLANPGQPNPAAVFFGPWSGPGLYCTVQAWIKDLGVFNILHLNLGLFSLNLRSLQHLPLLVLVRLGPDWMKAWNWARASVCSPSWLGPDMGRIEPG